MILMITYAIIAIADVAIAASSTDSEIKRVFPPPTSTAACLSTSIQSQQVPGVNQTEAKTSKSRAPSPMHACLNLFYTFTPTKKIACWGK